MDTNFVSDFMVLDPAIGHHSKTLRGHASPKWVIIHKLAKVLPYIHPNDFILSKKRLLMFTGTSRVVLSRDGISVKFSR